jgi:RNA polymerase sigma-70 factor (ECF subfamily)
VLEPDRELPPDAVFPTTRWTRVVAAKGAADSRAQAALAELCGVYWYPIYACIRRRGFDPETALDLTQDYFARLLEGDVLAAADRRKGRFRAFLRTDCGYFLAHRRERDAAQKRGGGKQVLSIDARDAEGRYLREPADPGLTPDRLYDRAWAIGLLEAVLDRLAREHAEAGQAERFAVLQVALAGDPTGSYADLASRLGTTEGAVQAAVSRLRKRYREILREHIAATLDEPTDDAIDAEIGDLFAVLGD